MALCSLSPLISHCPSSTYLLVTHQKKGVTFPEVKTKEQVVANLRGIKSTSCKLAPYAYCIVAVESAGRQIPIAFLDRVKDDFIKRYAGGKAATAVAKSLNKEFGSKLKEHMQYCVDNPEEICKLAKVKVQVSEVKGVMMENIEKILDRGEKIELLVDKTENLHFQAQDFRQQGTQMKRKMWLQNVKMKLTVLGILIALILIIIFSVCGGFKCT